MEDINYVQIDTWQITIIIALLIITMVGMLLLMGYFYLTFIKPLKDVKPSNNNQPHKRRGRPRKEPSEHVALEEPQITPMAKVKEDRLVNAAKSVPLPHIEDIKKIKGVKLIKPKEPEEWMSELDTGETDE